MDCIDGIDWVYMSSERIQWDHVSLSGLLMGLSVESKVLDTCMYSPSGGFGYVYDMSSDGKEGHQYHS